MTAAKVVFLSFTYRPSELVQQSVVRQLDAGAEVLLVTMSNRAWLDLRGRPGLTLRAIGPAESRHPARGLVNLLVNRLPRKLLRLAAAATRRVPRVAQALLAAEHFHARLGRAFDRRIFLRVYGLIRPHILAKVADREVGRAIPPDVGLILAADVRAVNYGYWLACRYPTAVASADHGRDPLPALAG